MKPAAMGMFITIVIVLIAVTDKWWNYVEPGLWLNHPATSQTSNVQRPMTTMTTTTKAPSTPRAKAKPASRKPAPAKQKVTYPINVPY